MINRNLLKFRIDVRAIDDTNFLELAILLDKPEFLDFLPQLRKEYGIYNLANTEDYYSLSDSFAEGKKSNINFSKYKNSKHLIEYALENRGYIFDEDPTDEMEMKQLLDTEANLLCYLFKRPPYFAEPIKQAILCGAVDDYVLRSTSIHIVERDNLLTTTACFQLPQVAILISPTSTDKVIKDTVRVARILYKKDKRLSYYKPRTDMVTKIKDYRSWYWMHLAGKRYVDIANEWSDRVDIDPSDSGIDDNRVLKGVNYYKRLLSV